MVTRKDVDKLFGKDSFQGNSGSVDIIDCKLGQGIDVAIVDRKSGLKFSKDGVKRISKKITKDKV